MVIGDFYKLLENIIVQNVIGVVIVLGQFCDIVVG